MAKFTLKVKLTPAERNYTIIITSIFLIIFILQSISGRLSMNDFKVYYLAAKSFLTSGDVYHQAYGLSSGYYKYSPFALIIFVPFSLLPFFYAKSIYFLICTSLLGFTIILAKRLWFDILAYRIKDSVYLLIATSVIAFSHLFRDLQLGNINLILLLLSLLSLKMLLDKKNISAAFLIGIILLFKPHFLILLPLLAMRKRWTTLLYILFFLVIGILIPSVFVGFKADLTLHSEWIEAIAAHNASFLDSQNTLQILLYKIFIRKIFPEAGNLYSLIIIVLIALIIFVLVLRNLKNEKKLQNNNLVAHNFSFEFFILIGLIPSLVLTDTEHFLYSIPIIIYILIYLFHYRKILMIIISIITFLLYVGTWGDVLGKYSYYLEHHGSLGIGNLMIIGISLYIYTRNSIHT